MKNENDLKLRREMKCVPTSKIRARVKCKPARQTQDKRQGKTGQWDQCIGRCKCKGQGSRSINREEEGTAPGWIGWPMMGCEKSSTDLIARPEGSLPDLLLITVVLFGATTLGRFGWFGCCFGRAIPDLITVVLYLARPEVFPEGPIIMARPFACPSALRSAGGGLSSRTVSRALARLERLPPSAFRVRVGVGVGVEGQTALSMVSHGTSYRMYIKCFARLRKLSRGDLS